MSSWINEWGGLYEPNIVLHEVMSVIGDKANICRYDRQASYDPLDNFAGYRHTMSILDVKSYEYVLDFADTLEEHDKALTDFQNEWDSVWA